MIVEKGKKSSPEHESSGKGPSCTLILNGSPENILKESLSPTTLSYLGILRTIHPTQIINTQTNQ